MHWYTLSVLKHQSFLHRCILEELIAMFVLRVSFKGRITHRFAIAMGEVETHNSMIHILNISYINEKMIEDCLKSFFII